MKVFGFGIFKPSSLKDYVMKIVSGSVVSSGKGKTFLVTPRSRFASVPTAERTVTFDFTERTSDNQSLNVQGMLSIVLLPEEVTKEHDFTIDLSKKSEYVDPMVLTNLDSKIEKMVQSIARSQVQEKILKAHMADVTVLARSISSAVITKTEEFKKFGVEVKQVFVDGVSPENSNVDDAFEAIEREQLLSDADKAIATRRMSNAEEERKLRKYEAETKMLLETQRAELIEAQSANLLKEAKAKADAKKKELGAYQGMDSGTIFALAMNKFAEEGRVGTLNIAPDMLESIRSAANNNSPQKR